MPADRATRTQLKQTTLAGFSKAAVPKTTNTTTVASDDASDASKAQRARPKPSPLLSRQKAKAKTKAGDEDRALTDVVISIKPEFTKLISERKKNYEYRKYRLKESVDRLWLYETAPTSAITYVMETSRPKVPGEVNDPSGIGNDDFDKGLKQSKYGYPVTGLYRLKTPLSTSELKQRFDIAVPQGWRYATKRLVDEIRLEDMDKLF
ncbi:hypothetical protein FKP32DRAFT_944211 [Trametes sanguinea]|nr:hypothetical protein FKP32DRAFT_944211 [Trametes sanguinea]